MRIRNNPIIHLLGVAWKFGAGYRPKLVLYMLLMTLAMGIELTTPYIIGLLINEIQTGINSDLALNRVLLLSFLYFGVQFGFWLFHGPARIIERLVSFHITTNYKLELFRQISALPAQWHRDHHSGQSIDKVNNSTNGLWMFLAHTFELIYLITKALGAFIILLFYMPFAGVAAAVTALAALVIIFRFDIVLYQQFKDLNDFSNKVASAIHDYITNIFTIITLRLRQQVKGEVQRRIYNFLPLYKKHIVVNEIKWFITSMLVSGMIVFVLCYYVYTSFASGEAILAGTFFTLFEYLRRIGASFFDFAWKYGETVKQSADVRNADSIFEAYENYKPTIVDESLPDNWRKIELSNLNFTYEDEVDDRSHLSDVSLSLEKGKKIALVGESGSGKSTLLSILRGLHSPQSAAMLVDGQEYDLNMVANHTTLVPQDPEIFADTIRFNVNFGIEADDDELVEVMSLARFAPVLSRLPKGLDTNIAEKGVNLSGGEKQRLALARGIYFARNSDIILLDEPTSSVDVLHEKIIYKNLLALYRSRCVVSSIHKLYLADMFDYIYLFKQGQIVEHGTLQELIDRNGLFTEIWNTYLEQED